jgi:hypothetical protein
MNSHLTSAKSCSWYAKAMLRDLGAVVDGVNHGVSFSTSIAPDLQVHGNVEGEGWNEYDPQQDPDIAMEFGPYGDELQFLPVEPEEIEAGHQPQTADNSILRETTHSSHTVLDDDNDERITIVDEDAGRIFRKEAPPKYTQVDREGDAIMGEGGKPNPFEPFTSELDWRVAHWAVKDWPGHNAFNRFLEIPGVSDLDEVSFSFVILYLGC